MPSDEERHTECAYYTEFPFPLASKVRTITVHPLPDGAVPVPEVVAVLMFAAAGFWSITLNVIVLLLSLLLMFIVLIQRGKGGGLAGAFGGVGGSSPFGSRAGDAFTKITLYLAAVWVLVIMIHVKVAQVDGNRESQLPALRSNQ